MKKFLPYIIIVVIIVGIYIPTIKVDAQLVVPPATVSAVKAQAGDALSWVAEKTIVPILSWTFWWIQKFTALLMGLGGLMLNYVIKITILDMSDNVGKIIGINIAWKIIRDLMNIVFIFILVYEGILMIIGLSNTNQVKKFIGGVILASLLINFSLFFTKVIIDASNIVTIGIYNSIVDAAPPVNTPVVVGIQTGLADKFQQVLGLQGFYSTESIQLGAAGTDSYSGHLIANVMASVLFLITAFVFFAVSIMFVIRYIVLIILLTLSPIAYMGMALPSLNGQARDWWNALWGQIIFAPIFMIMMLIVLTLISNGISGISTLDYAKWATAGQGGSLEADGALINLFFNFAIIIALTIASLITAKKYATQGSSMIGKLTGEATSRAGGALMGTTGWLGRRVVGNTGRLIADRADLQNAANRTDRTGWSRGVGALARAGLYGARTARNATFDVRNASLPTSVIGDAIEGTVGRTRVGRTLGLNDVNIPNAEIGAYATGLAGTGKGATKGVVEERADSAKRVQAREATNASELAIAQAKEAILAGANIGAGQQQIDAMEQALARLSDKQTEALVESNRDLLKSQNFANSISVKQLETLNKSEKLSDSEKDTLKNSRFTEINTAMTGLQIPIIQRTPAQVAAIADLPNQVRNNLADSELEMLNPDYLRMPEFVDALKSTQMETIIKSPKFTSAQKDNMRTQRFRAITDPNNLAALAIPQQNRQGPQVAQAAAISGTIRNLSDAEMDMLDPNLLINPQVVSQLRAPQVEAVTKSTRLTTAQKDAFRTTRRQPLMSALALPFNQGVIAATAAIRGLGDKEVAALDMAVLQNPIMINIYNKNRLKRMAPEMNPSDIPILRNAIINNAPGSLAGQWLQTQDGIDNF